MSTNMYVLYLHSFVFFSLVFQSPPCRCCIFGMTSKPPCQSFIHLDPAERKDTVPRQGFGHGLVDRKHSNHIKPSILASLLCLEVGRELSPSGSRFSKVQQLTELTIS